MGTEMEHVQVRYLFAIGAVEDDWDVTEEQAGDRFDRWLAGVWDEAYAHGHQDGAANEQRLQMRDWWAEPPTTPNPFRTEDA